MKDEFYKAISKINDTDLREACCKLADTLPAYFWTAPASSSGKYHPMCDLGEGGLVRHSLMVCKVALDLYDAEIFMPKSSILPEFEKDMIRVTALFHDCLKQGCLDEGGHTVFTHPILAAECVSQHLYNIVPIEAIQTISSAIKRHMGRWTTSQYDTATLEKPETPFDKLIHTADYVASRKYIGGLEDWNEV